MIRLCDQCGGNGLVWLTGDRLETPEPCPRCEGMPWLSWRDFISWAAEADGLVAMGWYVEGESARPDHESVMRWCFTHDCTALSDGERCWSILSIPNTDACDVGWVARPERLEVAE
jgi:hypothetical protein